MTAEQRKLELINLITSIDNESLLMRMEELIEASNAEIPDSILKLLDLSNNSSNLSEHKSVTEFLK